MNKTIPNLTLYYKTCTKDFPVLLWTTKFIQTLSQYYFVLQINITTCLETFEKERFYNFPHRYGIKDVTTTRRRPDDDATDHSGQTRVQPPDTQIINGNPSLHIRKNRIICDKYPKSSNHQFNATLSITNQHTHNLEFCILIIINYVISLKNELYIQIPEFLYVLAKSTIFAKHTSQRYNDFFLKQIRLYQMPIIPIT